MFSILLVTADSYQAAPVPGLDPTYSDFRGSEVKRVPVIRIFGSTQNGEKTCLHIHGVFPYIYVPCTSMEDGNSLAYNLATSLDSAINVSLGCTASKNQHVFKIQKVSGIPLYGYHKKKHQFFKVYFYNPAMIKKATDLLQNGLVLKQSLQPHEAHIPYILQFMIDYNIYGMSTVNVNNVKYRRSTRTLLEMGSSGESNHNSEPSSKEYLAYSVVRQSTCELEVDALASDILNRKTIEAGLDLNPGLATIWNEERTRRAQAGMHGGDSQLMNPLSPDRPPFNPTDNDLYQAERLAQRLLLISQCDENSLSTSNTPSSYPVEVQNDEILSASCLENHLTSDERNGTLTRNHDLVTNADKTTSVSPLVQEKGEDRDGDSSILTGDDMQLVEMLMDMAQSNSSNSNTIVDDDSVLGSQFSDLLRIDNKNDHEDDNEIADLNLTCLELDTMSSWDITQKSSGQSFISENNTKENNVPSCSTFESAPHQRILPTEISNNSTDIQEEDDIPQYDGAGDLSPKVLKSEIRPPNSNIAKNLSHSYLTLSPKGIMNIQENNSSTQLESSKGSTYVVCTETNVESDILSSDCPYGVLNELFEHLSQVESDLDLDLDNCQSISEIKMLSFNSNEGSDMNKQNIMDECISTKTVLNGDPCFTESAVFDKSDLTELQDQYASLLDSSLLPHAFKDLKNVDSINLTIIEDPAVPLVPEIGKKLDAPTSPCFDSLTDINTDSSVIPKTQDCDNNRSLDVVTKLNEKTTEHVEMSPDDFDYNCNVIATWEELEDHQCTDEPLKKCSIENSQESVNCQVSQRITGQFGSEVGQPENPSHASNRDSISAIQKGEEIIECDTNVIRSTRPKRLYKNSKKCINLKCNEVHDRLNRKKIVCKTNLESVIKSNGSKCTRRSRNSKPIDEENSMSNVPVDASLYSHYSSYRSHSSDLQGVVGHRHVKYSKKKIHLKQCSSTNQIWVIEKRRRGQRQKSDSILCTERQCPIPVIRLKKIDLDAASGIKTLNFVDTGNDCASKTTFESPKEVENQLNLKMAKKKSLKHIKTRKCMSVRSDVQPVVKCKKERLIARKDIHAQSTSSNVNNNCDVETTINKSLDCKKESNLCNSCHANNENLIVLDNSNAQGNKKQRRRRSSGKISINACPDVLSPVKIKTGEQPQSVDENVSKTGNFAVQEVTNSMDSRTRLKILLRNKIINKIDNSTKSVLRQGNVRQCQNIFCDRITRKKMSRQRRREPVIVSLSSTKTVASDDCQVNIDSEAYTLSNEIDELTIIANVIESNNETLSTPILERRRPMEDIPSPANKTLEDTEIYEHFVRNTDICFSPNREYDVDVVTSQVPECLFEEDFAPQSKEERENIATSQNIVAHAESCNKEDCSTTIYHQGLDVYDEDDLNGSSETSDTVAEEDAETSQNENLLNDVLDTRGLLINSIIVNEIDSSFNSSGRMKGISDVCAESEKIESEIKTNRLSFTENKTNEEKSLMIKEIPVYHRKVSINLERIDLNKLKMYLKPSSKDKSVSRPEEIIKFKHTEKKDVLSQKHDINHLSKKAMKMIDALHSRRSKKNKSTHNSCINYLNMPITEKLSIARKLDPDPQLLAHRDIAKQRNKVQTLFADSKLLVATTSYNEMRVNISNLPLKQRFMYKIGLCDVHMKRVDWLPTRQTTCIQLQEPRVWLQQQSIIIPKKAKRTRLIRRQYKTKSSIPAFDGAGDTSSDESEPIDPDVTVEREEKRICIYKSSRKSAQENVKTIATPSSKRKQHSYNSDNESPRKRINVGTAGLSPKTPLQSPLRTSTLQSPGRISRTYSPLNIVITSPKVSSTRKEPAECSDRRGVDTNSDMGSCSQSGCVTPKRMRRTRRRSPLRENSVLSPINEHCEGSSSAKVSKGSNSMDQGTWIQGLQDNTGTCASTSKVTDANNKTTTRSGTEVRKRLDFVIQSERGDGQLQTIKEKEVTISGTKLFKVTNEKQNFNILQEEYSDNEENEVTTEQRLLEMSNLDNSVIGVIDETADQLTDEEDVHNVTFTQYVDARLNEIRQSSQDLKTYNEENGSKEIDILPEIDPPSRASVIESMESYGIPKYRNKTPFYSNVSDIPAQKAIFQSRISGMSELPNWKSFLENVTGIRKWRRMKVDEFHPSGSKLRSNITQALAGHEFMDIEPLFKSPSPKNVRAWLEARKSKMKSNKETTDHQQQIEQEQRQNKQNDSITVEEKNECSMSNISNLVLPVHETTKSCQQYKDSLSAVEVDRANDTGVKSQQWSLRDDAVQENVSIRDITSDKLTNSTNPKLSLYNKSELSRRLGISCGQIEGVSHVSSDRDVANENLQNVKAIVTVHVCTRGSLLPDPQHDSISAIFYAIQNDVPTTSKMKPLEYGDIIISPAAKNFKNNSSYLLGSHTNCETSYVSNEKELLNALLLLIGRTDPDIFIGWEIECLSWGYVFQRANYLGLNLAARISRIPNFHHNANTDNQTPDLDALAGVKLSGRIILNAWRLMRHEAALLSYTFESVMFHVMKERHPCPSFETLTTWWSERNPRTRWKVVDHYITRVLGVFKILDQLDLIGRTGELARLFGIQFYEVFSRGSQFRVESMMLRLAKPLNYVPVSPSTNQRAHMRAPESLPLIMEPESQFYSDPVIVLDFQSLYPSIIIAYNYCFSTCLGRIEHIGQSEPFEFGATTLKVTKDTILKLGDNINFAPCGVAFVKPEVRRGILPRMLSEILDTRLMVKKAMKDHSQKDRTLQRALHSRQLGLKLIANVTYGYTAANFSGRMPCIEIGDSVVSKGRETLERAIKIVESKPEWGARVIYGDTDSLFVLLPGKSKAEAFKVGAEIADTVTAANPRPVKLKFEKVLHPAILQTKKRYCGYMYESPDQEKPEYLAKGIETVRRDGCPAVSKILEKSLRILFDTIDVSLVKQYVTRQLTKILQGRVSIEDLTFAREFRGIQGYKASACVPALELTRRLIQKDPRAVPRVSERVRYIIVAGAPNEALIHCVRSPWELISDPGLRPNAIYYITRVIIPPLNRCFNLFGVDINAWFNEMPHHQIVARYTIESGDKQKTTISQYFGTAACAVCGQFSKNKICHDCAVYPERVLVILQEKLRQLERGYYNFIKICQSCVKRSDNADCASLDCPVLYRRMKSQRDLEQQGVYLRKIIEDGNSLNF
ncbi:DNA polymerase zeta catalytic subunit isoform X2 [Cephus cinctus]|uniref:DNA polymerase zeta catalytic subunit n=1 Tax=Cephus cinctus TaxID=211228 RepID=A0AAJ7BYX2_CEPCN|nr:DNA polymerase zeta catalytic subunit isoform X2 [Cephus cinctus]